MTTTATTTTSAATAKRDPLLQNLQQQHPQPQQQSRPHQAGGGGCGGDGCSAPDSWPLHHVRHRSVFCRLCTSCVLRYHPGSFCTNCFNLFDGSPPPSAPVVHCSSCPSISHASCLPDPGQVTRYLCPTCVNPNGFSYFPIGIKRVPTAEGQHDEPGRPVDQKSAKVLLAAAQLALGSMKKAAAAMRVEAERKAKESVLAKKRAREMLERALFITKKEKEKEKESEKRNHTQVGAFPPPSMAPDAKKRMTVKPGGAMKPAGPVAAALAAQKKIQSREREKIMKFHEPIPLAQIAPGSAAATGALGSRVSASQYRVVKEEIGKNAVRLATQANLAATAEEKLKMLSNPDAIGQMPRSGQDASLPNATPRAMLSGSSNTAVPYS